MNKSEVTLAILIDYSKAFDTIDQNILLEKLLKFNFSPQAIEIIFSYISDREQYVQVDDKSSEMSNMYFGVPQLNTLMTRRYTTVAKTVKLNRVHRTLKKI